MTPTRYFFSRAVQPFGLVRRNQRMAEAATEMRLLREAEAHLGHLVWERVSEVEDLSVEYWNLRRLMEQRKSILEKLNESEAQLHQAHEQRVNLLSTPADATADEFSAERDEVLEKLKTLARRRDEVIAIARSVRRTYEGLQMKKEVLSKEAASSPEPGEDLAKVKARLAELKMRFEELKEERIQIGKEIDELDVRLDALDERLNSRRKAHRMEASEAFVVIGKTNKELSTLRAELGLLESKMRLLQTDIGRHISRQTGADPACAAAAREFRGLIAIMKALRRSIALNHRLAGMD